MACQLGIHGTLHAAALCILAFCICSTLCAATLLGFGLGMDGTAYASTALHKLAYPLAVCAVKFHVS